MNREDYKLAIAAPSQHSVFTVRVMDSVACLEKPRFASLRALFRRPQHMFRFAAILFLAATLLGFTGYAYASGTDPVELIRRIVKSDRVQVEYKNHTLTHGKKLTYSDAAITAEVELNMIDEANFYASHAVYVPKDGVEYFDDITDQAPTTYVYPKIAEITRRGTTVTVHEVYLLGDKITPSQDLDTSYDIALEMVRYYQELKLADVPDGTTVLAVMHQAQYLRHIIGSGNDFNHETIHFAFRLSHPLADYLEADKPIRTLNNEIKKTKDNGGPTVDVQPLIEENIGAFSGVCMNNGRDDCSAMNTIKPQNQQSLYVTSGQYGAVSSSNPAGPKVGEDFETSLDTKKYLPRQTVGTVTAISVNGFTIRSSSGAQWSFAFNQSLQNAFAKNYSTALRKGDRIWVFFYQPLGGVDSRSVPENMIEMMQRFVQ